MVQRDIPYATAIDKALGQRIRARRQRAGMPMTQLAKAVGLSFQQLHRFEMGANRISFSRLVDIAHALGCRSRDLIGELIDDGDLAPPQPPPHDLNVDGAEELLAAYAKLPQPLRRAVVKTLTALGIHGKGAR